MCNPAFLAVASLVGTGVSAYGQYQSGKFNESVAKNNMVIAERKRKDAIERGKVAAAESREETARRIASQQAALSASNIQINADSSAMDLLVGTRGEGELDALRVENNAIREAYGFDIEARDQGARAKQARTAGNIGAASTLLTGGSDAIYKYDVLTRGETK